MALKLRLKNYRRFLETDVIAFPAGLTIVTGPNGAGKTTLVESLSYALFGPKRGPGGGGVRSDNVVGEVEVYCALQIDGHEVEIHRKGNTAKLCLDGTIQVPDQPGSTAQVSRQIRQLLGGLTRDQFEEIYVAEQGQTAGLVAAGPKDRLGLLKVALQLDVLEEACQEQKDRRDGQVQRVKALAGVAVDMLGLVAEERKALGEFDSARAAHTRRQHLDLFLAQTEAALGRLQETADEATRQREAAEQDVAAKQQACEDQREEVDQADTALKAHEKRWKAFDALREPIATQEALRRAAVEAAVKKQREIEAALGCVDAARLHQTAETQLELVRQRLGQLPLIGDRWRALAQAKRDIQQKERDIAALGDPEETLRRARKEEAQAEARLEALLDDPTAAERGALERRVGEADSREKDARAALDVLADVTQDAPCPTCGRPLDSHSRDERLKHLQAWLDDELPGLRRQLGADRRTLDERQRRWQEDKRQAEESWRKATKAANAASANVERLKTLESELASATDRLTQARAAWAELGETQPWDSTEEGRLRLREKGLARQIEELAADAERYASLERLRSELEAEQERARRAAEELERLRAEQIATGYEAEAHDRAKASLQAAEDELERRKEALRDAEGQLERRKGQERAAREVVRRGAETCDKLKEAASDYLREEQLLGLLDGFRGRFFAANTAEIARRASQLIAQAVTDGSILGVAFERSGDLYYLDASHARQPVSRLSGGEKALVGLCLRIAVTEQALRLARTGKLHFLVLDEVLSSLDDERREAMQRVFDDVQRRGIFEHVIMITHLDTVKHGWQGTSLRVEKVGPKSSRVVAETASGATADGAVDLIDAESAEVAHV